MARVIVTITPMGVQRISLAASTEKEERASLALYRQVRQDIDAIKTKLFLAAPASKAK